MALGEGRRGRRQNINRRNSDGGLDNLEQLLVWVDQRTNRAIINTALRIQEKLRSNPPIGTPVDTGWASNNWTMTVDTPDTTPAPPPEGDYSFLPSFNPGIVAVLQFDINRNRSIYVQNNVPYINKLNQGWSRQSPEGFVEDAIDSAVAEVAAEVMR